MLSCRRASGDRHQQLKWLLAGSAVAGAGLATSARVSGSHSVPLQILGHIGSVAMLAVPVCLGVAVLRYLATVVQNALEPAQISVWMNPRG